MIKFTANILVFALLFAVICLWGADFLINDSRCASNEYMQAAYDKHKRLASNEPQVVVMGGSNVSFGLDSAAIAELYGMDVVNMGLHAGLDMHFMLDSIRDEIDEGDIVLLLLEYNLYTSPSLYSEDTVFRYVKYYPRMLKYVDIKHYGSMLIDGLPAALRLGMNNFLGYIQKGEVMYSGVYDRNSFNKYGDLDAHWDQPHGDAAYYGSLLFGGETPDREKLDYLDEFCKYAVSQKRAREVIVSFPPVPRGQINISAVDDIVAELEEYDSFTLAGIWRDYIFETDMFYDTYYHLSGEGVRARTAQLVRDLQKLKA
ncbi:MAG: hypothetical protein PHZ09_05520 [Eubacteriales bacterium]|nr:hypothetical protein [Eubacteriales bacterium]